MFRFIVLSCFIVAALCQETQRQCTCAEIEPCKQHVKGSLLECADKCQSHVTAMGGNFPEMRQCLQDKESMIQNVVNCEEDQLEGACAKGEEPGVVPKRYPETLKMAAFTEVSKMLAKSGIQSEAKIFLTLGQKFVGCTMKCMNRGPGKCFKDLNCGLALPTDTKIIQSTKQCAMRSGFNTQGVQQLCHCLANAGVKQLNPLCDKIQIN